MGDLILLVAGILLCLIQAFVPEKFLPKIHKGWLGVACFIATFVVIHASKG